MLGTVLFCLLLKKWKAKRNATFHNELQSTKKKRKIKIMETVKVNFIWDGEADVWVAISDDVPLTLESGSLDALMERVKTTIPEILAMNGKSVSPQVHFHVDRLLEAV